MEENEEMKQYFTDPGLSVIAAKISEMHQSMQLTLTQRTAELSIRSKAETNSTTKDLTESLRTLFSAVNVAMIAHPEVDYQPLVKELNAELKVMKASLKKDSNAEEETPATISETTTEKAL